MKITPCEIADVLLIEPRVFGDERGFFLESWNRAAFAEAGIVAEFVQDNHSRSQAGVLRGLHFQNPLPQGKLVRVTRGSVFDVAVDLRRSSATFGHWTGRELSARDRRMMWIPAGFAHGFLTLEEDTDFLYKCTAPYRPEAEHCLAWDDPAIGIDWPLSRRQPTLSGKDRAGLPLAALEPFA